MKVLLVDDHTLFSKSLSIALSDFPEIEKFSSTKDIEHLAAVLETEQPDILLVDINLGKLTEEDGLLLTKHLLAQFPEQNIVILSGYDLPAYRKEAKRIGAKGFINKEVEPEELLRILRVIQNGGSYFPQENILLEDLTESERQILKRLAAGSCLLYTSPSPRDTR